MRASRWPSLAVNVLDADGEIDKTNGAGGKNGDTLQLSIGVNPGGAQFVDASGNPINTTTNPIRAVVSNGTATFSGVRLNKVGTGYTLVVQAVGNDLLTPFTSNGFDIIAGAATALAFQIQPNYSSPADVIAASNNKTYGTWPGIVVQAVDKFQNPVTDASGVNLANGTVTIKAFNSSGQQQNFSDATSSKTATLDPKTAVATFAPGATGNGLQIAVPGIGYTLQAAWTPPVGGIGSLTSVTSQKFNVSVQRQNSTFDKSTPPKQLTFALLFDPTTPVPTKYPVGKVLPPITLTLMGVDGKVLVNDSTDRISMVTGGVLGTLDANSGKRQGDL